MSKNKKNKKNPRNEFRKLNSMEVRGHPTYIYAKEGNSYNFIGITHAEITSGVKNIPLSKNPEPNNQQKAYLRPCAKKERTKLFGKRLSNWKFADSDKVVVKGIIDNGKQNKSKKSNKKRKDG